MDATILSLKKKNIQALNLRFILQYIFCKRETIASVERHFSFINNAWSNSVGTRPDCLLN